jgi:hypothetical protein
MVPRLRGSGDPFVRRCASPSVRSMSLSVVATTLFLLTVALAAVGGVRRSRRPSWFRLARRLLRHERSRRVCIRLARRHLRRRYPAVVGGLVTLARATRIAS